MKLPNIHSFAFRQSLLIMTAILLVFFGLFVVIRRQIHTQLGTVWQDTGVEISEKHCEGINSIFHDTSRMGQEFADALLANKPEGAQLDELLTRLLNDFHAARPEIIALVFAPAVQPNRPDVRMRLAQWHHENWGNDHVELLWGKDYGDKPWYRDTCSRAHAGWCEPFIGSVVTEPIVLYTIPLYESAPDGTRRFLGIATVDLSLQFLRQSVNALKIPDNGYPFILSSKFTVIAHPNPDWIFRESLASLAKTQGSSHFNKLRGALARHTSGLIFAHSEKQDQYICIFYTPMKIKGWTFGIVWPAEKIRTLIHAADSAFILATLCGLVLILGLIFGISSRVSRPLSELAKAAHELGQGHFQTTIPTIDGQDEIAQFANAFTHMRNSLQTYIDNLEEATAVRQRIESELALARTIQLGVLPNDDELAGDHRFSLGGTLRPAREVGGDFYDFYRLDSNHIAVLIGDVSGKGVPSAMFMMVARVLIKSIIYTGATVDAAFNFANRELASRNKQEMFVTAWLGILDLATGHLEFTNAGHNPPIIRHADGTAEFLHVKPNFILAGFSSTTYRRNETSLAPDDTLILYTDGVTEARSRDNALYGDDRLLSTARALPHRDAPALSRQLLAAVDAFADGAEQADDITIVALHRCP